MSPNSLMMRIYAAMSRKERELISKRIRAALRAAKARGAGSAMSGATGLRTGLTPQRLPWCASKRQSGGAPGGAGGGAAAGRGDRWSGGNGSRAQ